MLRKTCEATVGRPFRRYGGQMLMVRCNCVVGAARLARAGRRSGNGKTRRRSSNRRAWHRLFRHCLTGGRLVS
jgi:hypothetical protein